MKIRRRTTGAPVESQTTKNAAAQQDSSHTSGSGGRRSCWHRQSQTMDEIVARRVSHKFFLIVSVLVVLCALWMIVGQVLGIVIYENSLVQYVLRGYVIILAVLVVLIEIEWPQSIRETTLFRYWISRGLFYLFVGVIGLQESETAQTPKNEKENEMYETMADIIAVVAWNMAGCGILYFVMGVLCLQFVLDDLREDYQARLDSAHERLHKITTTSAAAGEGVEVGFHPDDSKLAAIEAAQSVFAEGSPGVNWEDEEDVPQYPEANDGSQEQTWVQDTPDHDKEIKIGADNRFSVEISREMDAAAASSSKEPGSLDAAQNRGLPDPPSTESVPLAEHASKGSDAEDDDYVSVEEMNSTKSTDDAAPSRPDDVEVNLHGSPSSGRKQ